MIDLSTVDVIGSPRECLTFPTAARLNAFGLVPGAMFLQTVGAQSWPEVAIDSSGVPVQAATLWVFLQIGGIWRATGAERLRGSQVNGSKPESEPPNRISELVGNGWLYDPNRWHIMSGYNPQPGEGVGVMLVSGSTRSDDQTTVRQRTNILVIAWPNDRGANPCQILWDEGNTQPAPVPTPAPQPEPPPTPLHQMLGRIADATEGSYDELTRIRQILQNR